MPKADQLNGWATVAEIARLTGKTPQGIHSAFLPHLAAEDIRRDPKPMIVRTAAIISILVERQTQKTRQDSDPLLSDGDSPALERYRLAKAKLAELDLEHRKGDLIDREKCRELMGRWSVIIRRMGERLGKRYGNDATLSVNDSLDECQKVVDGLKNAE